MSWAKAGSAPESSGWWLTQIGTRQGPLEVRWWSTYDRQWSIAVAPSASSDQAAAAASQRSAYGTKQIRWWRTPASLAAIKELGEAEFRLKLREKELRKQRRKKRRRTRQAKSIWSGNGDALSRRLPGAGWTKQR
jgi:hypothetical protein